MKAKVFDMAKRQYTGQLLVGSDQREAFAMNTGKSILYYDEVHDINWTSERILALTAEDVRSVAEDIMKSEFSILTLK
jgi:predicted Zn-dependent peptidase